MKSGIPNPPLVVYWQPCNLKDLLVRVLMSPQHQTYNGSSHCGRPCCKNCARIKKDYSFTRAVSSENFYARLTSDHKTSSVTYLIDCCKCNKQYNEKWRIPYILERMAITLTTNAGFQINLWWNIWIHQATHLRTSWSQQSKWYVGLIPSGLSIGKAIGFTLFSSWPHMAWI